MAASSRLSVEVESVVAPLGLGVADPVICWRLPAGAAQQRATVRVSAPGPVPVWEHSVYDPAARLAVYTGPPLEPRIVYTAEITVETATGATVGSTTLETALSDGSAWLADWISLSRPRDHDGQETQAAVYLWSDFHLDEVPPQARLSIASAGLSQMAVNGVWLDTGPLHPGFTDTNVRVPFTTHDVRPALARGSNRIAAVLADGWYSGTVGWEHRRQLWGERPALRAQLDLITSGVAEHVTSGSSSWHGCLGRIVSADLYRGCVWDGRQGPGPDWTRPGSEIAGSTNAQRVEGPPGRLWARLSPVTTSTIREPAQVHWRDDTTCLVDAGKNMAGWLRLEAEAAAATGVSVEYGEVLDEAGELYRENLVGAACRDEFVVSGGRTTLDPAFTYRGFRYAKVHGLRAHELLEAVPVAVRSPLRRLVDFECSDRLLTSIVEATAATIESNAVDVLTDCPQRDERLAWGADIIAIARTLNILYDARPIIQKYVLDVGDTQSADGALAVMAPEYRDVSGWVDKAGDGTRAHSGWSDGGPVTALITYHATGDPTVLTRGHDTWMAWIDYLRTRSRDSVILVGEQEGFGDWLYLDKPMSASALATTYYVRTIAAGRESARLVGDAAAVTDLDRLDRDVRAAFAGQFIDAQGRVDSGSQTAQAVALRTGLVPAAVRAGAEQVLVEAVRRDGHISTGIHGIDHLLDALSDAGQVDLAYDVLLRNPFPSYAHFFAHGATTIPERWEAWDERGSFYPNPASNSFNHFALGAASAWILERVGGLRWDPSRPGYAHVTVAPAPPRGAARARTRRETSRGELDIEWEVDDRGRGQASLVVPPDTTVSVRLPGEPAVLVGAGNHSFRFESDGGT